MSLAAPDTRPVVVTGASSGIGTEIARGLGRRRYPVVLVARRRDRLDDLASEIRETGHVPTEVMALDLNEAAARAELAAYLGSTPVAGLVNSAGFGTNGVFHSLPAERLSDEVTVNVLALMELTRAALPGMVERRAGAVLNIASIAGFQPVPGAAVYSATKAFVQSFSEAVHEELHGTGVSCTTLAPGPVPTEWWAIADDHAGPSARTTGLGMAALAPQVVAEAAIAGMLAGKRTIVPGVVPKIAGLGGRFTPRRVLLPALRIVALRK